MATDSAEDTGGICCPDCGCKDFRTHGTKSVGPGVKHRYKICRHCGHQILTSTKSVERIIREVPQRAAAEEEPDDDPILKLA